MTETATISLTDAAAERIKFIATQEKGEPMLRLEVLGGGCSGYQYGMKLVATAEGDDIVIENKGAKLVVDPASLELLKGSAFDYVTEMIGSSFQVKNPQAASSCGCGNSFSL